PAAASDLQLDGQTVLVAPLGATVATTLTGNPGLPALVAADTDPGPIVLFGESVPIGLSPALTVLFAGSTGAGTLAQNVVLPADPSFLGATFHLVGVVIDPGDANGFDFSNGATLTIGASDPLEIDLVGKLRAGFPGFDWVETVPQGEDLVFALDPATAPGLAGSTADVYVTADRTQAEWDLDPTLVDVSNDGADAVTFGADLASSAFTLDLGTLNGDGGATLGIGYDVVVDRNGNGLLDGGDYVDGYLGGAGCYVVSDPAAPGPYAVTEVIYSLGTLLGQDLYYPSNVASLGELPLVVVSHGNGHNYQWYDHIGFHLASYGFVVMSHQNNTQPGIEAASTTTLDNTDKFLRNLANIAGGALAGHVDSSNITWIGHSRGGEGVVRAYDRLIDGTFDPVTYGPEDIQLISSIAPTDFLGTNSSTPHAVDYHLWVGQSDSDVTGCADNNIAQSKHLLGRAEDQRQGTSLNGVGHAFFHNGGGNPWSTGPCLVPMAEVHTVMRGYLLPLVEWHIRDNPAARDYLVRQYEDLHPQSAPLGNPCVVVNLQYRERASSGKLVLDDFQTQLADLVASSGATITHDLTGFVTGRLDDNNTAFTTLGSDTFNGFTYANTTDPERGAVLLYDDGADHVLAYDLAAGTEDWTGFEWLALRVCQSTRHPATIAEFADTQFAVRLVDTDGDTGTISTAALEAGVSEPYQRTSCGTGTGWGNEFESIRIGVRGFTAGNPALDLDSLDRVEFLFGPSHGSPRGFLGLDDLELHVD
ncbi:MAG TPA: hypothetical protein VJP77_01350, partial [Planctomycetota bacterium]|nr:hypothetical protein [Planctomycetota bacterium]